VPGTDQTSTVKLNSASASISQQNGVLLAAAAPPQLLLLLVLQALCLLLLLLLRHCWLPIRDLYDSKTARSMPAARLLLCEHS
jgi:hypothetical protein